MVTCFRYSKLSPEQIDWLNKYNEQVMADVAPRWVERNYLDSPICEFPGCNTKAPGTYLVPETQYCHIQARAIWGPIGTLLDNCTDSMGLSKAFTCVFRILRSIHYKE